ncbi:MAG: proprotein convertase P-domain-containing protein, partial [Anaerolineae bacterium]
MVGKVMTVRRSLIATMLAVVLVALGAAWTPGEARSLGASAVSVAGTDAVISPGGPVLTAEEAAKLDPWLRFALAQSATRPGPAQEQAVGASVTQRWGEMLAARETTVGRLRDLHAGAPVGPVRAGTRGQLAITASSPVSLVPAVITPDTWLRLVVVTSDPAALEEAGAIVRAYSGGVAAILVRADDLAAIAQPRSVTWIGGPTFVQPANDLGRDDAGVPEAARQFGADGAGATVVIIDSGVDWTHASFVDSAGHTRIRALLDLSVPGDIDADGVLDGAGPGGGTLYTAADIDRALGKLAAGVSHQHSWPSGPAPVPDKGVLKAQVTVPKVQSTTVETLHVRLRLGHGAMGDISLRLVAPDGRAVVLLDDAKGGTEMLSAAYEVRGLEGLSSAGTWTLEVADDVEGSYGRLYDWTLMVNMPVLHQDLVGHGTHVAGTAAGDDAAVGATEPGPLAGAAPAADLVVAAVSRDFGDSITIDDLMAGTAWADSYARGIGQPYVANMSLGGYAGARDGSAPLDLFVDGLFGPGQGGGALVAAIGNDGDYEVHAGGEFGPDDDHIALDVADGSYIELIEAWFEGPSTTEIGLRLPGGLECLSTDPSGGDVREDCDRLALRPGESRMVVMVSPSGEGAAIGELAWAERDAADGLYQVLFLLLAFDDSLMA